MKGQLFFTLLLLAAVCEAKTAMSTATTSEESAVSSQSNFLLRKHHVRHHHHHHKHHHHKHHEVDAEPPKEDGEEPKKPEPKKKKPEPKKLTKIAKNKTVSAVKITSEGDDDESSDAGSSSSEEEEEATTTTPEPVDVDVGIEFPDIPDAKWDKKAKKFLKDTKAEQAEGAPVKKFVSKIGSNGCMQVSRSTESDECIIETNCEENVHLTSSTFHCYEPHGTTGNLIEKDDWTIGNADTPEWHQFCPVEVPKKNNDFLGQQHQFAFSRKEKFSTKIHCGLCLWVEGTKLMEVLDESPECPGHQDVHTINTLFTFEQRIKGLEDTVGEIKASSTPTTTTTTTTAAPAAAATETDESATPPATTSNFNAVTDNDEEED